MEIPTAASLRDIYPEDALEAQQSRWEKLLADFKALYGRPAEFVARSPGRVNIIGEHIDYSMYEVLPMAITADVLIVVAPSDKPVIRLASTQPNKFLSKEVEIPADGELSIDASTGDWTNYFLSSFRGATDFLRKGNATGQFKSVGLDLLIDGSVPSGGGLSSSAAMVCASVLATLKANGEEAINKKQVTELAITAERGVGVNTGGMDQSASVFGKQGSALYVSFQPELSVKTFEFPETDELNFLVAQTFVAADKHVSAAVGYNLRVVECSLAAVVLSRVFGLKKSLPTDESPLGVSLRGFHNTYYEEKEGIADNSKADSTTLATQLTELMRLTEDYLAQEEGYTRQQIAEIIGLSVDELNARFTAKFPVNAERFMLRQRAIHVFSEAIRVNRFIQLITEHDSTKPETLDPLLRALGTLMNDTQDSCRDIYNCSCPELDELCQLARSAGAYGSRLTGAGWGGCSVHLVPKSKVEKVKQAWIDKYYRKRWPDITESRLEEAIVVSKPGSGSTVYKVVGDKAV